MTGRWGGVALAAVAGIAAALGQVPWLLWWLVLPSYAGAIWLVAGAPGRWQAGLRAWVFGTAHFLLALHWITEPFQIDAARDAWMAPFALVFMAGGLALFWGAAGIVSGLFSRRALAFALALAGAEATRGVVLTGFPWALPGHVWLGLPPMQLAAVVGAGGLTLITLGLALLPVLLRWRGAGLAVALLGAVWGWGHWRLGQPLPPAAGPLIRLVQPNADQRLKWQPDHAREFFNRHLDLTAAPAERRPDLVVWPETAVPFLLDDDRGGLRAILAASGGTPVALGIQRTDGLRGYNALAVIGPGAVGDPEIRALYDKAHLVPFGEYIPLGDAMADWLGIFSFSPREGFGYSAGPGPRLLDLGSLGTLQPLICYEAVFPYFQRAVGRPGWMLQVTNDAWFGDDAGPFQHLALARLRAVENGVPLVRVANTGVSAMIDARGGVLAEIGLNRMGHLDVPLPGALPPTPYARLGGWPAIVAWLLGCLMLFRYRPVKH
ncbi:apolipoprotein N-acyltransferase [Gemmobacter sp.]|uniref:apolipoprotein N-acyltransferase n=1 Tax=Gemmobacter sp. TaxID=1898957 RepID=UPI002AFFD57C|nr:apolipoprotein N-acyltransferase [Gemmobacter sp.]